MELKKRTAVRLYSVGISNVIEMYDSSIQNLKRAYGSVCGYYWFLRLHGVEIDDVESPRKSFGNQHVLPKAMNKDETLPILQKLVEKMGRRLREGEYTAHGVHLALWYNDHSFFHRQENLPNAIFSSQELYARILNIFKSFPEKKVREISVGCFNLSKNNNIQEELFFSVNRKFKLSSAIDKINNRYGDWTLIPAQIMLAKNAVFDRIAFGKG